MYVHVLQPPSEAAILPARIDGNARPAPHPEVTVLPLDDELVLAHPGSSQTYTLNKTAGQIWSLCDGSNTVTAVAGEIAASYGLDLQQAIEDVHGFLSDLHRAGLLTLR